MDLQRKVNKRARQLAKLVRKVEKVESLKIDAEELFEKLGNDKDALVGRDDPEGDRAYDDICKLMYDVEGIEYFLRNVIATLPEARETLQEFDLTPPEKKSPKPGYVRCIDANGIANLTEGKDYVVSDVNDHEVMVFNDKGAPQYYSIHRFEFPEEKNSSTVDAFSEKA